MLFGFRCIFHPKQKIVNILLLMEERDRLKLRYEIARKTIHLASLSIPLIYSLISRELVLLILIPLFTGFFVVDVLKNFIAPVARWYHKTFDAMLRSHELKSESLHLNGATYMMMAALLLVLFFPKLIAITAFTIVAVSDTIAAVIGKSFGKHKFGEKSIEGSLAFFVSAVLLVALFPRLNIFIGIIMAAAATLTEAYSGRIGKFKIDDNLSIPLVTAAAGMLCYRLFIPEQIPLLSICR